MHQWSLAFDAEFELQGREFGKPFAVFTDFDATGRGEIAQRAIQSSPIVCGRIQRHTIMALLRRVEKCAAAIASY